MTAAERERALIPDQSFIVQAPAGSGKTGLLVQRILRLLSVVERPESIVAVTFTIKAAAEMRERVVKALSEASSETVLFRDPFHKRTVELARSALSRDRAMGWNLMHDSSRLHLQTIDALSSYLVRQMPLTSDSGGIGRVTEDADELYRQAARQALQQLAEPDQAGESSALFRRLALHFDNNIAALERQIVSMLAKRDTWQGFDQDCPREATVVDFLTIVAAAETELRKVFQQRNTVDFTAITRAAITALGAPEDPSDLLYALDYRIEHLLVDEFQDTSRAQFRLLEALTGQWSDGDGRTLFLVGDPMQSIYGFRAAEVALFQQCWSDGRLESVRLQQIRLATNFRSTPQIVDWVQAELAEAFGEDDLSLGAVRLQRSKAARQDTGPEPQLIPMLDDRPGTEEAAQVLKILRSEKDLNDVAILGRSRSHVLTILKALRKADIRYSAVEIDPLCEQQHIIDLLSLTRALSHTGDRLAWLACLRAPWCGLTLADLALLVEEQPNRIVFDLLSQSSDIARLSLDGRYRTAALQTIFREALDEVGRRALSDIVQQTWFALGGPAILSKKNERKDAETFFRLLAETEEGGLIGDFAVLNDRLNRLYAEPDLSENCLRVMTIHEAKGLEFGTVILPHLASPPRGDDEDLLVWNETLNSDGHWEVSLAAQPRRGQSALDYDAIREAAKRKTRNEGKRLFYVACTRAKNRLFLLGSVKQNSKRTDVCNAQSHTFLGMIWKRNKAAFQLLQKRTVARQPHLFEIIRPPRYIARLPREWRAPSLASSVQWQPSLQSGRASEPNVKYEWVGGTSRHVGTIVHCILNRISRDGISLWGTSRIEKLHSSVRDELKRIGVDDPEREKAVIRVVRAVQNTLESERGRWILNAREGARSEWPLSGVIGNRLISGTIDRFFREDGRLWIIDYKTSDHQGAGEEVFLDRERSRYREQMQNYAVLMTHLMSGPVSLGLYFPLLDGWREWPFAEFAAEGS